MRRFEAYTVRGDVSGYGTTARAERVSEEMCALVAET